MSTVIRRPKTQWNHPKAQLYQLRMKRRPTRAERRFDDILDEALKDTHIPTLKQTQFKKRNDKQKRKFVKQKIFTDQQRRKAYIADFYIPALKLVFEIDGPDHDKKKTQDAIRSSLLASKGIKVIRYTNEETFDTEHCLKRLEQEIKDRITNPKRKLKYVPVMERPIQPDADLSGLTAQYLNNGGTITKCPTVGKNRKIIKH